VQARSATDVMESAILGLDLPEPSEVEKDNRRSSDADRPVPAGDAETATEDTVARNMTHGVLSARR